MKFDTPATTNPIDQLKVVGKPTDRIEGRLKTTGTAPYAYERHDVAPNAGVWIRRRFGHRQGPHRSDQRHRCAVRARCDHDRHGEDRQTSWKGQAGTRPGCSAVRRFSTITRRSRWSSPRRSNRHAPPRILRIDYVRVQGAFDLAAAKDAAAKRTHYRRPGGHGRRRLRRRVRRGAGPARCDIHHARSGARDDGAACVDRRLEGRHADGVDVEPDDRLERDGPGDDARAAQGKCPHYFAVRRRRLRRQALRRADALLAALGARAAPACEGGAAAALHVQQHPASSRNDSARPHRRDARRQDHRDRP